jgi:hypothetical protein
MKKLIITNLFKITLILLFASISVYMIYNYYNKEKVVDYKSDNIEVSFHESTGNKITLTNKTSLPDSVGLSTNPYSFTIKNNLTIPTKFKITIKEDEKKYSTENKEKYRINHQNIRVALKKGSNEPVIYTLSELENNQALIEEIAELGKLDYSIRIWVSSNDGVPIGVEPYYYGIIKVEEVL